MNERQSGSRMGAPTVIYLSTCGCIILDKISEEAFDLRPYNDK